MSYLVFVLMLEGWIMFALTVTGGVLALWAVADCVSRGGTQFERAGLRGKQFWLILTVIAAVVAGLGAWSSLVALLQSGAPTGQLGLFGIAALCVAAVYLAGPRRQLKLYGDSGYGY